MRIAIDHETVYRYAAPATYSIQYLRLTPQNGPGQRVLSWSLRAPGTLRPWTDAYGNVAHMLVLDRPHDEIRIHATGEIDSDDPDCDNNNNSNGRDDTRFPPALFLRHTRLTQPDRTLSEFVAQYRLAVLADRRQGLDALMHGIREAVSYKPGLTDTTTAAATAFAAGAGVCQDHAHIFVSCCRSLEVPARYVSGYLCTDTVGEERMASHAWAEAWINDSGWTSFDVANRVSAGKAHVRVAVGLDYLDACPVRGMRRGGRGESLDVLVSVGESRELQMLKRQQMQQQQQ